MDEYIIVGTAGHVDHGKTVLVKALTGRDTDRLKEEKKRGISIELGFAPLELPDGRKLGLVDVPGHERFIRQMLAGVGGMDLVMLVVAADEGVMPQTVEHLDIIDMLRIKKGLLVVTKKDLVDEEWLELVKEDIKEAVKGTVLEDAPIVAVSGHTGEGIADLLNELMRLAGETVPRKESGGARIPVDRVFTVTGFGTIVTGTLWSGSIAAGDNMEIIPAGRQARIRGLQVHGKPENKAFAGQRVAVNLAALDVEDVPRGSWLASPGYLEPTGRLDIELHLLKKAEKALLNRQRVRFYLGTAEKFGRVVLLDRDSLEPGEDCLAQLILEGKAAVRKGDRFVIRNYSPMYTIGGGSVIEPHAVKLKRYQADVIEQLAAKLKGTPKDIVKAFLEQTEGAAAAQISRDTGLDMETVNTAVDELLQDKEIDTIPSEGWKFYGVSTVLENRWQRIKDELQVFHQRLPLRAGMLKEEMRTRLFSNMDQKLFNGLLAKWEKDQKIAIKESTVSLADFKPTLTADQQKQVEQILTAYQKELFQPPLWEDMEKRFVLSPASSGELLHYLLDCGWLVRIGELVYHREAVERAKELISKAVLENGPVSLSEVRDLLGSSRKYILPLLEYLDREKFTKRIEDKRVLFRNPAK